MCGRLLQTPSAEQLASIFGAVVGDVQLGPRFNVSPSQSVALVRQEGSHRIIDLARWGFDRAARGGSLVFNARSESAATKPTFRHAMRVGRCVVPADGFYEWSHAPGQRVPFVIRRRDSQPLALAALWESGRDAHGAPIRVCTILTTAPNEVLQPLHDRMPVVLAAESVGQWLDPAIRDPERLAPLLGPCPAADLEALPVDTYVNDPRHEGPRCLSPGEPSRQGSLF
jgi:putative SOS response-associated peptidase YedK